MPAEGRGFGEGKIRDIASEIIIGTPPARHRWPPTRWAEVHLVLSRPRGFGFSRVGGTSEDHPTSKAFASLPRPRAVLTE
jgi:hypothetical protein